MRTTRGAAAALAAALLATGATLAACGSSSSPAAVAAPSAVTVDGVRHVDVDAFASLASTPGTILLDVRTPEEFTGGHLPGARLIDFRAPDFDTRLAALDRDATYAVYCHSGNRSNQALSRMAAAGFTHVADLSGGITAWTAAGRKVTT